MTIFTPDSLRTKALTDFDIFIAAVGYETRSSFVLKELSLNKFSKLIAIEFNSAHVFEFEKNKKLFQEYEAYFWDGNLDSIKENLERLLNCEYKESRQIVIGVDYSSMTRDIIATIISVISNYPKLNAIIQCFYAPAKFTPSENVEGPVTALGPVIPNYAGWSVNPGANNIAIVGLGYEYQRALGAIEYIDPYQAVFFFPRGIDTRYDDEVERVNANLFEYYDNKENVVNYNALDAYDLFIILRSLVAKSVTDNRVILLPFGPKVFFLMSLMSSEVIKGDISVWRVSGQENDEPKNREADGNIVPFSFLVVNE